MDNRDSNGWKGYPLTLARDGYSGVYSGGEWLAFALGPAEVPSQPWEGDVTAAAYWGSGDVLGGRVLPQDQPRNPRFVGRGGTPEAALSDLNRRMKI
jgi:hypothetical protein